MLGVKRKITNQKSQSQSWGQSRGQGQVQHIHKMRVTISRAVAGDAVTEQLRLREAAFNYLPSRWLGAGPVRALGHLHRRCNAEHAAGSEEHTSELEVGAIRVRDNF